MIELTGCEAQKTFKRVYKAALFYVEQTVTMHIVLFNVLAQMLLLVSCLYAYQYLLCFVQGQGQRTKEKENKNMQQRNCRVS